MTVDTNQLRILLSEAGYRFVEPPILSDANVFLEVAGEDLRRRLYLTTGFDGSELCLRPEFTIPVCLHHLATGDAHRMADYAYLGPVFRQRPGENGEFLQGGVESLGRTDRITADADVLALALDAVRLYGLDKPIVRIGDSLLFSAVIEALGIASVWRRRLSRVFGDRQRLDATIERLSGGGTSEAPAHAGFLAALDGTDHAAAHRIVEDLLSIAGIKAVGGRSAGEIADRFLEQSSLAVGAGLSARAQTVLKRFLDTRGTPEVALAALKTLSIDEDLGIEATLDGFEKRAEGLARRGIDLSTLDFAADFGRRLDYYSGFVFEIYDEALPAGRQVVGGGRYDRLMPALGAKAPVPAVGFSLWLDRVKEPHS
ncbi:ATP phosphoribosyltransferase regulatory subunit [Kaistia dalseonensis]|uniref:ATP phosphoribosyltransferase regulatory subunit n=1 Tax=Kaistia dalseonensis TaxID=410840 RepID=A0ABU0H6U7_9HYPH|nr:ATP phosphoribosyltransferase regulatory subunit [Kaistia dalseonensis]MCX5495446.1 ATP phosphoribosyltransferase regulatory subunit [Kaistia dalseonensis]MDQ0438035.1 ATP phosphoribosyltransferase regulatory subunit [Kaistia dalseonensis]